MTHEHDTQANDAVHGHDDRPVRREPAAHDHTVVDRGPSMMTTLRRIVILLFGILQAALILRIVLLLLGANEGNEVVALIIGVTDPFVAPFLGMFDMDTAQGAAGSELDVAALAALVAWTLVEALVLAILGLADRRERAVA